MSGELFTEFSDHPHKLVTLSQNSNQQAPDIPASFRWWDAYRKQLGLKDFSPKSRDAVALQQIKGVTRFTYDLIVVISVRQSTVAAISGLHCRALVMVSSSIRLTAWLQNSKKRAERSEIDVWAKSPRLSPLWLSASSSRLSWAVNHYRDNAVPTKPSATKYQRTEAGERGNYWHADASAWCLLRSMQNTRRS